MISTLLTVEALNNNKTICTTFLNKKKIKLPDEPKTSFLTFILVKTCSKWKISQLAVIYITSTDYTTRNRFIGIDFNDDIVTSRTTRLQTKFFIHQALPCRLPWAKCKDFNEFNHDIC